MKKATKNQLVVKLGMLAFLLLIMQASFAQQRPNMDPTERAEAQTAKLKSVLQLSEEQTLQVRNINLKYATKMKEESANSNQDRNARRELRQRIQAEQDAELKAVLTDAQWQTYLSEKENLQQAPPSGQRKGRGKQ